MAQLENHLENVEPEFYLSDESYQADYENSPTRRVRRSSVSMHNLSNMTLDVLHTPLKPGHSKSITNFPLNKTNRNRYSHVESKVKQYRKSIQEQQRNVKLRRKSNDCNVNNSDNYVEKTENKSNINDVGDLVKRLEELEKDNTVLKESNEQLMQQYANAEIKLDYFRLETSRLTTQISASKTPKVNRKTILNNSTPIQVINNPLKTPGAVSIKTPLNNACRSYYLSSESDISSSDFEESSCSSNHEVANKRLTVHDLKMETDVSMHSDDPLLQTRKRERRRSLTLRVQDAFRKVLPCSKNTPQGSSLRLSSLKSKKRLIKFKQNKVHPEIVMSSLHTPIASQRQIKVSTVKCNKIPKIIIGNDSPLPTLTPMRNLARDLIKHSKNNLEGSTKKILNGDVDFKNNQHFITKIENPQEEVLADMAFAYADEVIELTQKFKKQILQSS